MSYFKYTRHFGFTVKTSELMGILNEVGERYLCVAVHVYIRDGIRWWQWAPKFNDFTMSDKAVWMSVRVHTGLYQAYPEAFLPEYTENLLEKWVNCKALGIKHMYEITDCDFDSRIRFLAYLIYKYGDREITFDFNGAF